MSNRHAPDSQTAVQYEAAGFSGRFSLGAKPALLVIDLSLGFTSGESPLGSDMQDVLRQTARLLTGARARNVFTIFTTIAFDPGSLATLPWVLKVPSLAVLKQDSKWAEIDPSLGRLESEPVIAKTGASGFFGTPLQAMLAGKGVDTVLVAGATTSGCVRATVVDAVQSGYQTFVIPECVGDRAVAPHEASLFDMTAKYADAVSVQEALGYFESLPPAAATSPPPPLASIHDG